MTNSLRILGCLGLATLLVCSLTPTPVGASQAAPPEQPQPLSWELCIFACNLVMAACMDQCMSGDYICYGGCVGAGTLCSLACGDPQPQGPPENGWTAPGSQSPAWLAGEGAAVCAPAG